MIRRRLALIAFLLLGALLVPRVPARAAAVERQRYNGWSSTHVTWHVGWDMGALSFWAPEWARSATVRVMDDFGLPVRAFVRASGRHHDAVYCGDPLLVHIGTPATVTVGEDWRLVQVSPDLGFGTTAEYGYPSPGDRICPAMVSVPTSGMVEVVYR